MRVIQIIAVVMGALLMSGCGDQFWCGEDGCRGKNIVSTSSNKWTFKNSILQKTVRTVRVRLDRNIKAAYT